MNIKPTFLNREDLASPTSVATSCGETQYYTHRAPDKETDNEDSIAVIDLAPDTVVLVVADGLGGERAGSEASRIAIESMVQSIQEVSKPDGLREGILSGFELANETVRALGIGAATTLAVAEIRKRQMRAYHVGDSSVLVCGQRGKDKFQSLAHSPTAYAVEAGLMDEADAMQHEHRHLVSNVVGSEEMRIDMGPLVELADRDTVVLASDGLTDNLYYEEIVEIVPRGYLSAAASKLLSSIHERMGGEDATHPGKPDDLSFILFRPIVSG
jgi:serine/threonine protein phosphatase PrpC